MMKLIELIVPVCWNLFLAVGFLFMTVFIMNHCLIPEIKYLIESL